MFKSILVVGGCGFIGANLVPKLLSQGAQVRVLDNLSRGYLDYLGGHDVEIIQGDIRNETDVARALNGVECVVHLAAYGSVVESLADPWENFDVNVRGTLMVLQMCKEAGVSHFVFASTGGALIGNAEPPVDEGSLPKPLSPYGASKLCGEAYCHAFAQSYGMNTIGLRFANVYGPFSTHKRGAVTVFFKAVRSGEPITIYGDGTASRDLLYVDDLCHGIMLALTHSIEPGQVLHLASGVETCIGDLAKQIALIAGKPSHPIRYEAARRGEVGRNFARFDRAHSLLGFKPRVSLVEGLERSWKWYQEHAPEWSSIETNDS